jgi:hypothetical protein
MHEEDRSTFYLDQLCTIALCGLLGGICILLWWNGGLNLILHTKFHPFVLAGGIAILALVVLRAITLWVSTGRSAEVVHHDHDHHHHDHDHGHVHDHHHHDHDHGHDHHHHDHDHGHDHHHHDHDHGHDPGHDHGWAPWRYVVLLLPCVLFFLNLPNQGFSQVNLADVDVGSGGPVEIRGDGVVKLNFKELDGAEYDPGRRNAYEGIMASLKGQFAPSRDNDKRFSLVRFKITCCAADAIPNRVVIESPESLEGKYKPLEWVEVTGQVQFRKRPGREEYVTVLQVLPLQEGETLRDKITPAKPDANPYLQ